MEEVRAALSNLSQSTDRLVAFRKRDDCAVVCFTILRDAQSTPEQCIFAAQSLVYVARHRPDLAAALIAELGSLAPRFAAVGPVFSQLALGLAAAAVRIPSSPSLSQEGILKNLLSVCSSDLNLCLRVLTVMAEEVVTSSMSPVLRSQWTTTLRGPGADMCLHYVLSCLADEAHYNARVGSCVNLLAAWLAQGVVGWNHLVPFMPFLARELHSTTTPHEALVDILVAVCELHAPAGCAAVLAAIVSHPCLSSAPHLSRLLTLCARPSLQAALDQDMQAVWPRALHALLLCLQREHLDLLVCTLEFWADYAASKLALLAPDDHYQLLARCVLCGEYPTDFAAWSSAAREQFHDMRNDLRNTLRPLTAALPSAAPWLLTHLTSNLCNAHAQIQASYQAHSPGGRHEAEPHASALPSPTTPLPLPWPHMEVFVHAATATAKLLFDPAAPPELQVTQCTLIDCLTAMPAIPGLQCSVVTLCGLLSDWLAHHPDRVPQVLHLVIKSLHLPEWDAVYPMRICQDHVAGVALIKLARFCSSPPVLRELFSAVSFVCGPHSVLTRKSARLVLQALCMGTHALEGAAAADHGRDIALLILDALSRASSADIAVDCLQDLGTALAHMRDAAWAEAAALALQAPGATSPTLAIPIPIHSAHQLHHLQPHSPHQHHLLSHSPHQHQLHHAPPSPTPLAQASLNLAASGSPLHGIFDRFLGHDAVAKTVGECLTGALVHATGGPALASFAQGACTMLAAHYPQCPLAVAAEVFRCTIEAGAGSRAGADSVKAFASSEAAALLAPMIVAMLEFVSRIVLSGADHSPAAVTASYLFFACIIRTLPATVTPALAVQLTLVALRLLAVPEVSHARDSASAIFAFLRELVLATGSNFHQSVFQDENGIEMCRVLLTGARGGLPGWMLEDIVAVFRALFKVDNARAAAWLGVADPAATKQLVPDLVRFSGESDLSRFKNALKHFCGGKKKGTEGTPSRSISQTSG